MHCFSANPAGQQAGEMGAISSAWQKAREGVFSSWTSSFDNKMLEQGPAANRLYGGRMNENRHQQVCLHFVYKSQFLFPYRMPKICLQFNF